jgi:hypothetical protein
MNQKEFLSCARERQARLMTIHPLRNGPKNTLHNQDCNKSGKRAQN